LALALATLVVGLAALGSLWLIAASLLPGRTIEARMAALMPHGATQHSSAAVRAIAAKFSPGARLVGIGLALVCALLLGARRRLARQIGALIDAASEFCMQVAQAFGVALRPGQAAHLIALALLCALGVAVRLHFLFQPMRYDEAFNYVGYANGSVIYILSNYSSPNNHLFHTLLVHFSIALFGPSVWAIRLPAFVAGCLCVPAGYLVIRQLGNRGAALLAAALLAGSSPLIQYSVNARGYSIMTLASLLLILLGSTLIEKSNAFAWSLLAAVGAIGIWTVPVAIYPLAGVLLWIALASRARIGRRNSGTIRNPVLAGGITLLISALLYLPAIAGTGIRSVVANPYVKALAWPEFVARAPAYPVTVWRFFNLDLPAWLGATLTALFLCGLLLRRSRRRIATPVAPAVLAATCLLICLQHVLPFERTLLFLVPLYLGEAAIGVTSLLRLDGQERAAPAFGVAAVIAGVLFCLPMRSSSSVYLSEGSVNLRDVPQIARDLKRLLRPEDGITAYGNFKLPLAYYLQREGVKREVYGSGDWGVVAASPPQRIFLVIGKCVRLNESPWRSSESFRYSIRLVEDYTEAKLYLLERDRSERLPGCGGMELGVTHSCWGVPDRPA
jgi:hypothetical protein